MNHPSIANKTKVQVQLTVAQIDKIATHLASCAYSTYDDAYEAQLILEALGFDVEIPSVDWDDPNKLFAVEIVS